MMFNPEFDPQALRDNMKLVNEADAYGLLMQDVEAAMLAFEKFHDRWCRSLPYATVLDLQDVISGGDQLVSCKMCRTPKYRLNNEQVCGQCRFA